MKTTTMAVILAGCGNRDGSETHETLSALLAMDRRGISYKCFAPQGDFVVYDHSTMQPTDQKRNILIEAARLCRGDIQPLENYNPSDFDALVLPGGMGAAQNWSTYAFEGKDMSVLPEIKKALIDTHNVGKPIGAMCIAPMILAKVFGSEHILLTLGSRCEAAEAAMAMGCRHKECPATDAVTDHEHKIVTTPAYMVATHISQIFDGADKMIEQVQSLIR